jgi:hypothetical protein
MASIEISYVEQYRKRTTSFESAHDMSTYHSEAVDLSFDVDACTTPVDLDGEEARESTI